MVSFCTSPCNIQNISSIFGWRVFLNSERSGQELLDWLFLAHYARN
uniref:Uncharacterized protein n=1 Tax=Cryptosporidium parvum TaxID=5807 RepID=F0X538_CRYPV